jgi:DNA replication protein DnaC
MNEERTRKWEPFSALAERVMTGIDQTQLTDNPGPACLLCRDTGMEITTDGARRCQCEIDRVLKERIAANLAVIPPKYSNAVLSTLQPRSDLHKDQPRIIASLKENPDRSYFFCGKPDAGKSHLFWSLYHHEASQGRVVFTAKLFKLIEAIKAQMFSDGPDPLPDIEVDQLSIYLEDVSKARPTEFVAERFFDFLDDAYNRQHRIVVTSQLAPEDLIKYFERAEGIDGRAIVRRMVNDETSVFRLF